MVRRQFLVLGSYATAAWVKLWHLIKIWVAAFATGLFSQRRLLCLIKVQRR